MPQPDTYYTAGNILADFLNQLVQYGKLDSHDAPLAQFAVRRWIDVRCQRMMMSPVYSGYAPRLWSEVTEGDTVYLDGYESGVYADADPKITGPYQVIDAAGRRLCHVKMVGLRGGGGFTHIPQNLLVKVV